MPRPPSRSGTRTPATIAGTDAGVARIRASAAATEDTRIDRDAAESRTPITRLGAPLLRGHEGGTLLARRLRPPAVLGPLDARVHRGRHVALNLRGTQTIEAIFLDETGRVRRIARVPPGRIALDLGSAVVLEVAAGTVARIELDTGHVLRPAVGGWKT